MQTGVTHIRQSISTGKGRENDLKKKAHTCSVISLCKLLAFSSSSSCNYKLQLFSCERTNKITIKKDV